MAAVFSEAKFLGFGSAAAFRRSITPASAGTTLGAGHQSTGMMLSRAAGVHNLPALPRLMKSLLQKRFGQPTYSPRRALGGPCLDADRP